MRYTAKTERRIAVLPIGYGDGFPRVRNEGGALIHGKRAPLVGGIAMDALMVDITDIPEAQMWDEAVIMGRQGNEEITVRDIAKLKNSVTYDVLTNWRLRLRRKSVNGPNRTRINTDWSASRNGNCFAVNSSIRVSFNMKLLFSEQNSDYEHYQFPYAIWAVPEDGETPSDIFDAGFPAVVAPTRPLLSLPPGSRGFGEVQAVVRKPPDPPQRQRHRRGTGTARQI